MIRLLHRLYRIGSAINEWVRRRITPAGWLVLITGFAVAGSGSEMEKSAGTRLFLLCLGLWVVALAFAPFFRGRFEAERLLPHCVTVGEPVEYEVRIRTLGTRRLLGLQLLEQPADTRLDRVAFAARLRATRRTRPFQVSHRPSFGRGARFEPAPIPILAPGEATSVRVRVRPSQRGILRLDALLIARADPFGLFRSLVRVNVPGQILVLPRRYPVSRLENAGSPKHQHRGVALASRVGESEEFLGLREYRPGDPLRRIHWRSWARAGQPITKEYQDEHFTRQALVLDTFTDPDNTEAFEEAVSVAASFAAQDRGEDSLLDLMFVGNRAYRVTAGRGLASTGHLLEVLASVTPSLGLAFTVLRNVVLEHSGELSGALCVFVEWDEVRREFVRGLLQRRIPLQVFVVIPSAQKEPPESGLPELAGAFRVLKAGRIREDLAGAATAPDPGNRP
jgi:uncharacterized protein (DUF58 family)